MSLTFGELININLWYTLKYPLFSARVVNDLNNLLNSQMLFPFQTLRASQVHTCLNPETIYNSIVKVQI